jgi:hypothetical protein
MTLLHLYRAPGLSEASRNALLQMARQRVSPAISGIETEFCYNIDAAEPLDLQERGVLEWLLRETFIIAA